MTPLDQPLIIFGRNDMRIHKSSLLITIGAISILMLLLVAQNSTVPAYWLNLSSSEPLGLYRMEPWHNLLRRGEIVVMKCPKGYESYLYGRKWLPKGWPLFKTVGAIAGKNYCVTDKFLSIDGTIIGPIFLADSQGRPLPAKRGCWTIPPGRFLPIATGLRNSFDGRYFGDVPESLVIGKAIPLLTVPR